MEPPVHQCDRLNPSDDVSACATCDYYEPLCRDCHGRRKVGPGEAEVKCPTVGEQEGSRDDRGMG